MTISDDEQAPRRKDPGDPVTASPDEVAAAGTADDQGEVASDPLAASDPNVKADTTKGAAVEPAD
jgi:hypothetical protein